MQETLQITTCDNISPRVHQTDNNKSTSLHAIPQIPNPRIHHAAPLTCWTWQYPEPDWFQPFCPPHCQNNGFEHPQCHLLLVLTLPRCSQVLGRPSIQAFPCWCPSCCLSHQFGQSRKCITGGPVTLNCHQSVHHIPNCSKPPEISWSEGCGEEKTPITLKASSEWTVGFCDCPSALDCGRLDVGFVDEWGQIQLPVLWLGRHARLMGRWMPTSMLKFSRMTLWKHSGKSTKLLEKWFSSRTMIWNTQVKRPGPGWKTMDSQSCSGPPNLLTWTPLNTYGIIWNGGLVSMRRLQVEWDGIEAEVCQNLIESMPRRVEAVYKAKGGVHKVLIY